MHYRRHQSGLGNELARMKPGQYVRVKAIDGGWHMRQRLNQIGIHTGDRMLVKQTGAFHGPMLVEVHGSQVALGCGMARKIRVEIIHEEQQQTTS